MRTVLRPTIRMVNAAFGWLPEGYGHVQCPDRQVPLHPIAHGATDHAAGMQIQDDGEMQPTFAPLSHMQACVAGQWSRHS